MSCVGKVQTHIVRTIHNGVIYTWRLKGRMDKLSSSIPYYLRVDWKTSFVWFIPVWRMYVCGFGRHAGPLCNIKSLSWLVFHNISLFPHKIPTLPSPPAPANAPNVLISLLVQPVIQGLQLKISTTLPGVSCHNVASMKHSIESLKSSPSSSRNCRPLPYYRPS